MVSDVMQMDLGVANGGGRMTLDPTPLHFGCENEYAMELAVTIEQRRRAWTMVYDSYLEKGYAEPNADRLWYGIHDALPDTRTLLITRDGQDIATLTLVFDSPLDLPADGLYNDALDELRHRGRRLCEITSLVNNETRRAECMEILNQAFHAAYLMAFRVEGATDFVITVNPHHAAYYERKLFFEQVGEERAYDKVGGAPAVLLRLPLIGLAERYADKHREKPDSRSFYRFFAEEEMQNRISGILGDARQSLAEREISTWFARRRPLLSRATQDACQHLRSCYSVSRWFVTSGRREYLRVP